MCNPFENAEVISAYTRAEAIDDGLLVDATIGDLAGVSRQHYKTHVAMTIAVFDLIDRADKHPDWCNDYAGVWHDILWMSKVGVIRKPDPTTQLFRVKITGTGRKQWHTLKAVCHPGDNAEPVITIMLPNED